jgi:cell division protein FtsQ
MQFRKLFKYLFFLVITVSLGVLYSFTTKRNQQKKVTEITIEFEKGANNFLSHAMVDKLLIQNNETVQNRAKSVINLYEIENSVLQNPYVEEAAVFVTIQGRLKARLKQRTPVARIVGVSTSYYIDKQGVKIPLSSNYSARVLLVSGIKSDADITKALPLIKFILNDNFFEKEIIGIEKVKDDTYQLSVRSGSYKIDFGKLTEVDIKFKKLKAFYNKIFEDKTISDYKKITLKYHNQVVCTK